MTWKVNITGDGNKLTSFTMSGRLNSKDLDKLLMMQEELFRILSIEPQKTFNFSVQSEEENPKSEETGQKSTKDFIGNYWP